MSDAPSPYPEHEKLASISEYSQTCYLFIDWLESKGIWLCEVNREDNQFYVTTKPMRALLADFFQIDMDKIEAEKRAMLEEHRKHSPPVSGNGHE